MTRVNLLMEFTTVTLILGILITSIATTPLNHNENHNDKNDRNLNYQYEYAVDDSSGQIHGKVETRSGELASGRYFINDDQSSTDVKYFADEWGYHPWVKYRASSEPGTANTHLTFDTDGTQIPDEVNKSTEPVQNFATQAIMPISQIENTSKKSPSVTNLPTKTEAAEFSDILEFSQKTINNQNQLQSEIKSPPINDSIQFVETLTNKISSSDQINVTSPPPLEEELLNENTGNFGQRLIERFHDTNMIQKFNNNYEDSAESSQSLVYVSEKDDPKVHQKISTNIKASNDNYKSALANFQANLESLQKSSVDLNESDDIQEQTREVLDFPMMNNDKNNTIQSAIELEGESLEAISTGSNLAKFSKPIVVVDNVNTEKFEYSTTLPCDDEDTESIPLLDVNNQDILGDMIYSIPTIPESENPNHIAISSVVLKPMQAEVAMINSEKSHLEGDEMSLTEAINESGFDDSTDGSQALKQIGVTKMSVEGTHKEINPVVGGDKLEKLTSVMPTSVTDQEVEIQKSLEVYHSAPVHEIHYPAQITSQVTSIDQQVEKYLTTQKHTNTKQVPFNNENVKSQTQIDLASSNSNNFEYISIESQPLMLLQEYQTVPNSNNPSYVSAVEQKVNVNNLPPENSQRLVQNYVAHEDPQRTKVPQENLTKDENFFFKSRINGQIPSPMFEKLSHAFVTDPWNRINDKSINQNVQVSTGQVQSQTQSNISRIPGEFTNVVQRLETDQLNYHDENQYHQQTNINEFEIGSKLNYPKSHINLTRQQIPIYTDQLYAESTKIVDNTIPLPIYFMDKLSENLFKQPSSLHLMHPEEQVSAFQAYPVTVKKIMEKKMPSSIQKFSSQSYPIHILQQYVKEKFIEKPLQVPSEKKIQIPVPYSLGNPLKISHSPGQLIYPEKSAHLPYSGSQIMHPTYAVYKQLEINSLDQNNHDNDTFTITKSNSFEQHNKPYLYSGDSISPSVSIRSGSNIKYGLLNQIPINKQAVFNYHVYPKKSHINQMSLSTHPKMIDHPALLYQYHMMHPTNEKQNHQNVQIVRSVSLLPQVLKHYQQNQALHPVHQELLPNIPSISSSRRVRKPEAHFPSQTGIFRQSKMEYGFKPPIVPSIQYDEETATKVEN
ncbi:uncharacterized protein [Chelonus insularis]|uniref:uncharacterized protein n=1 Tax=Chelonus insularis TaxID=460826 RepID=UPI00158B2C29|nr:uncharacterized protein LOC118064789 [Chelonus insularis]